MVEQVGISLAIPLQFNGSQPNHFGAKKPPRSPWVVVTLSVM